MSATQRVSSLLWDGITGKPNTTARPKSPRKPETLTPEAETVAIELHRRLHGKPSHVWSKRTWYSSVSGGIMIVLKILLVTLLTVGILVGGFGGGMLVGYLSSTEFVSTVDLVNSDSVQTTFVYDEDNNVIAKLKGSDNVDRVTISFSDIKDTYIDEAIIAIEDERYYEHDGIDIQRIASAILSAVVNSGSPTHGGSTITQQTVKMMTGEDERSAQRKVQEWFKAMDLEQDLSKDEIMEYYINLAPMGNNYIGVQAASLNYFGKDAKDLTLSECAFLAGIPKSPSYYNPLRESGKRNAMRRMRIVLGKMYELGKITKEQYDDALNSELVFKERTTSSGTAINSYFVDYAISEVISDLMKQRNITRDLAVSLVYSSGYKIYTTEDPEVQAVLDATYQTKELFQTDPAAIENYPEKPQSGSAVIDVSDGSIAGLQGGYGTKVSNLILNRATDIARQPGSSIKPLIDYAPAFESGLIVPTTMYSNEHLCLDPNNPGTPWPNNADGGYGGSVTIRNAIRSSLNVVAVQVWTDLNKRQNGLPLLYLKDVGIDRTTEVYPSTAIGGFNVGMCPLEMASAYATFAYGGTYREPFSYTLVLDSEDNVVIDKTEINRSRIVYSPQVCFVLTDILKSVITGGTAAGTVMPISNSSGDGIAVAGKTGTTDDNLDKWFCGYTPYYAAATWYGFDNRLSRQEIDVRSDRQNAMRIWNDYMQKIHANLPGMDFPRPEGIVEKTVCTVSGNLATGDCITAGTAVTDFFFEGKAIMPSVPCTLHIPTPAPTPVPPPPVAPTDPVVTPAA
jgi:penicillin-binding protein 1A